MLRIFLKKFRLHSKMPANYLPHYALGAIVKGFGRGSKELGIPTGKTTVIFDYMESSVKFLLIILYF